jgi:hypothetical protein
MPNPKCDYRGLEEQYVTGELSIRALAAQQPIAPSSLARQARLRGWYEKRAAYRDTLANRTYSLIADREAGGVADRNERIIRQGLRLLDLFDEQVARGQIRMTVRDWALIAATIRVAAGEPTVHREERLGLNVDLDADLINAMEAMARASLAQVAERADASSVEGT